MQHKSKPVSENTPKANKAFDGERIAKVMARAGIGSRRQIEDWILAGRVSVNGQTIPSPALNVTDSDKIAFDGKPIAKASKTRVWIYHKPRGLIVTREDELQRATIFDDLPDDMPRVISIGRLDLDSEGLLLLTNDGEYARKLELPENKLIRKYRVRVYGQIPHHLCEQLAQGVKIDGIHYRPIKANIDDLKSNAQHKMNMAGQKETHRMHTNHWLTLELSEGKNREIRRLMEYFDLTVNRLIRTQYGKFQLGNLERGACIEVKPV